jgi:endonuclease G, mitochondrial
MLTRSDAIQAAHRFHDRHEFANSQAGKDIEQKVRPSAENRRKSFLQPTEMLRFERTFDEDDILPIRYLDLGFVAARSVCRIYVPDPVMPGDATGFLVAPGLLLTNHHVLPQIEHAAAATATFDAEEDRTGRMKAAHPYALRPDRLYVADEALDFAFVEVEQFSASGLDIGEFGWLPLFPQTGKITDKSAATVIHHPNGQPKQITLRNNKIDLYLYDEPGNKDEDNNFIYYRTDTEPGSSGAPVFNDQWYVFALHRQGVPKTRTDKTGKVRVLRKGGGYVTPNDPDRAIDWAANEGIRISRIWDRLGALVAENSPFAAMAKQVLQRIAANAGNPRSGPLPLVRTEGPRAGPEPFELIRRSIEAFKDAKGHDPNFLGRKTPFPTPSPEVKAAVALAKNGDDVLHYEHFSIQMNRLRRMPFWTVVDIDGSLKAPHGARPPWSYDPRMDDSLQPDDKIFTPGQSRKKAFDRGHMVRQLDPVWGDQATADRAQTHTFCLTNVCPQEHGFNDHEWGNLEDHILDTAHEAGGKVVVYTGPIFKFDDPLIGDLLKGGPREDIPMPDIRVPRRFFKIVVWRDGNGPLKAAGFLRDQTDEIASKPYFEMAFGGTAQEQHSIAGIEEMTGLSFGTLRERDTLAASGATSRPMRNNEDAIL